MAFCGAKTRNGQPCQKSAMKNGRCRLHGGKSTGAPKRNKNNLKHGIYSAFFTDEENEIANELDLSVIDDELKVCKIRLMRALNLENSQTDLELVSKTVEPPLIGGVPVVDDPDVVDIVKKTYSKRDYHPIVDRLITRIQYLTVTRMQLINQSLDIELKRQQLVQENDEPVKIEIVRVE